MPSTKAVSVWVSSPCVKVAGTRSGERKTETPPTRWDVRKGITVLFVASLVHCRDIRSGARRKEERAAGVRFSVSQRAGAPALMAEVDQTKGDLHGVYRHLRIAGRAADFTTTQTGDAASLPNVSGAVSCDIENGTGSGNFIYNNVRSGGMSNSRVISRIARELSRHSHLPSGPTVTFLGSATSRAAMTARGILLNQRP